MGDFKLLFILWLTISLFPLGSQAQAAEVAKEGLKTAFHLLAQSKLGAAQLQKARELEIPIILGAVSKTDLVATRAPAGSFKKALTEARVEISLEKEPLFQALDLAHELVHALYSSPNPFDPHLSPRAYVRNGIEGQGGEAQAIFAECQAGKELVEVGAAKLEVKVEALQLVKARCDVAWRTARDPSKWVESFYHLGHFYFDFFTAVQGLKLTQTEKIQWKEHFKAKSPLFSSAISHKPYPLSLLEEYIAMTQQVCNRVRNRAHAVDRSLASIQSDLSDLKTRCDTIGVEIFHE